MTKRNELREIRRAVGFEAATPHATVLERLSALGQLADFAGLMFDLADPKDVAEGKVSVDSYSRVASLLALTGRTRKPMDFTIGELTDIPGGGT